MKVLSKIKRRKGSNELPSSHEYVEMDLFDKDRNPLVFPSGSPIKVHDLVNLETLGGLPVHPIETSDNMDPDALIASGSFTIENPCYALIVLGGLAAVEGNNGTASPTVNLVAEIVNSDFTDYSSIAQISTLSDATYGLQGDLYPQILVPATYDYKVWASKWKDSLSSYAVSLTKLGAAVMLVPTNGDPGLSWT
jgi:hypothetical protein